MTGKKIRNIWPVGGRASRSSRGIIVHRVCVCVRILGRGPVLTFRSRETTERTRY